MKADTTAIEQEIAAYEKQLRQHYSTKSRLMEEIDSLDPDDRHFIARKSDLDDRLYKMYDKTEEVENGLMDARGGLHRSERCHCLRCHGCAAARKGIRYAARHSG